MIKVFMPVRWPVGGIRTFLKYVYTHWASPELEIHFLMPKDPEVEILKAQLSDLNCIWHTTRDGAPSFKEFALAAFNITSQYNFDVVHAHGFTSAFSIALKLPILKSRSIFTCHDVLHEHDFKGIKGMAKRVVFSALLNCFNTVHSVSYSAEKNLLSTLPLIIKRKSKVVLNGVDTQRFFSAEKFDVRATWSIKPEQIIIGFFGRFMSQKGFKYLVDAVALLEKVSPGKHVVVCFGSGGFIREEKLKLEQMGLLGAFYFNDAVADTAPYLKGCDLVVMPSLWEACPLLPMEVLTAGVPLVASTCIGLGEVCEKTPAFMVKPADALSLKVAIEQAASCDLSVFRQYAQIAKERYSITNMVLELKKIYQGTNEPSK